MGDYSEFAKKAENENTKTESQQAVSAAAEPQPVIQNNNNEKAEEFSAENNVNAENEQPPIKDNFVYCSNCGSKEPADMMFCSQCGNSLK